MYFILIYCFEVPCEFDIIGIINSTNNNISISNFMTEIKLENYIYIIYIIYI